MADMRVAVCPVATGAEDRRPDGEISYADGTHRRESDYQ